MQELYAAWGTTREEHMARMMELVERLNAQIPDDEDEAATVSTETANVAEPAFERAAATELANEKSLAKEEQIPEEQTLRKRKSADDEMKAMANRLAYRLKTQLAKEKRMGGNPLKVRLTLKDVSRAGRSIGGQQNVAAELNAKTVTLLIKEQPRHLTAKRTTVNKLRYIDGLAIARCCKRIDQPMISIDSIEKLSIADDLSSVLQVGEDSTRKQRVKGKSSKIKGRIKGRRKRRGI